MKTEPSTIELFTIVNNPTVTKCKERLPKRFKLNVKVFLFKGSKQVLKDSTQINVTDNYIVKEVKGQGKDVEFVSSMAITQVCIKTIVNKT
jgi:hypothetical protein